MRRETKFREKIYRVVRKIPRGQTASYKEIAKLAGYAKAWRAVGNVLNKNIDLKIPCHRVIKSDGRLGGYNRGTKKKKSLLEKEGVVISNMRVWGKKNY
jgi:O-6-methylguanine DNA methyltransferase